MMAWKKGVKSLYYCRSLSIARADAVSEKVVVPAAMLGVAANDGPGPLPLVAAVSPASAGAGANVANYEECLACQ